jgi:choline dehydrogenase
MDGEFDFIVVGSGPGGGPLACRLAEDPAGYRVALLEAGFDPATQDQPTYWNHAVPGLSARASEDPKTSWEFFVQHYGTDDKNAPPPDSKFHDGDSADEKGIFYPRAAAIGGCASHHVMVTVYPHNRDWDDMARLLGDNSWSAHHMRGYFQRLEACQSPTAAIPKYRHGRNGWLPVSMPDVGLLFDDPALLLIVARAFLASLPFADELLDEPDTGRRKRADHQRRMQQGLDHLYQLIIKDANLDERTKKHVWENIYWLKVQAQLGIAPDLPSLLPRLVTDPALPALFKAAFARLDPNRWFDDDRERVGMFITPATTLQGVRTGVRERVVDVSSRFPDRLKLFTGALVTQVKIEKQDDLPVAVGVLYLQNHTRGVYEATPGAKTANPQDQKLKDWKREQKELRLRKGGEIILAGGAFNTPQLLMLSGVGPEADLKKMKNPKEVYCNSPGVGQNLHDRYEIALVTELTDRQLKLLDGSTYFAPGDAEGEKLVKEKPGAKDVAFEKWVNHRGVYTTNGVVTSIIRTSAAARKEDQIPDLFLFGLPACFQGYYKGYSADLQSEATGDQKRTPMHNRFTWVVLKGRTKNRAGFVKLRSANPLERPEINFKYFQKDADGTDPGKDDLDALVEGVRFVERIMKECGLENEILLPPSRARSSQSLLRDYIKRECWGHHACGTCKIGSDDDPLAVLDGDFRVRGVKNLRVVDASVFPNIPGFFIVTSIYMISEKAAGVILAARRKKPDTWPGKPGVMPLKK